MLFNLIVNINNFLIKKFVKNVNPNDIAILGPRCIQFNKCREAVVGGANECKLCGKCPIKDLMELKQECNLKDLFIVTGGSAARKFVKDAKIKLVIAIACERELALGILGVIPHKSYGIYLKKPNGPCLNTFIDKSEVKKALEGFIGR